MFKNIGLRLAASASILAAAAFSLGQLNERNQTLRLRMRELQVRRHNMGKRRWRSHTKSGPGRVHWSGFSRNRLRNLTADELADQAASRFARGYMNRGEALRFINAAATPAERAKHWQTRYGV